MQFTDYKIHELAKNVPEPSPVDYAQLKQFIERDGQQFPIIRHDGAIIDGRTRLKICCELGIEPKIKEYAGSLPIAQYILTTNIRRNLTVAQRGQLLANFAEVIIPEVKEAGKARLKAGNAKGGRSKSPQTPGETCALKDKNVSRTALMAATGATSTEAEQLLELYSKAPDLLTQVERLGGLSKAVAEARKRVVAKAESAKVKAKRNSQAEERRVRSERRAAEIDASPRIKDLCLSREEVDPELAHDPVGFSARYGHIPTQTKAQIEAEREQNALITWRGTLKQLRPLLKALLGVACSQKLISEWAQGTGRGTARCEEIKETLEALARAGNAAMTHLAALNNCSNGKP
jgi:hypothetical protein